MRSIQKKSSFARKREKRRSKKVDDRAIFIHGFAKNEKSNLSAKEKRLLKEKKK